MSMAMEAAMAAVAAMVAAMVIVATAADRPAPPLHPVTPCPPRQIPLPASVSSVFPVAKSPFTLSIPPTASFRTLVNPSQSTPVSLHPSESPASDRTSQHLLVFFVYLPATMIWHKHFEAFPPCPITTIEANKQIT